MKRFALCLAVLAVLFGMTGWAEPQAVYLRSTVGAPWEVSTNEGAMDAVFGPGNWADLRYETVDTGTLFSPDTLFIFMEGGDNNANALEAFLDANISRIEAWVTEGGRLLVNAAPNEGDGMSFGFGVDLAYPDFAGAGLASADDPSHPILTGPFTPVATAYTGNFFSHATVSGEGITSLLSNGAGNTVLAEGDFGLGLVLFGGMTTTNFHQPQPEAANLRANIISYTAGVEPAEAESLSSSVKRPRSNR